MEQRSESINSTTPDTENNAAETPLRRYLATFDQGDEGQQLLNSIRLYVHKANIEGERSTREIALEIMQEVAIEALRSEANFENARSPVPWLLGIAINLIKRRREKLFRRRQHETLATDLAGADEVTEEQLFDRLADHAQAGPEEEVVAAIGLDDLLAQLAPDERRIIELHVLHEMNGAEVGQEFGITPGNARVRFHRALTKLRAVWTAQANSGSETAPPEHGRPGNARPATTEEGKQSHE